MNTDNQKIVEIKSRSPEETQAKKLIWQVFSEFEGQDYSRQGVETFKQFISSDNLLSMRNHNHFIMWGYFINQELVGIIGCKDPSHITLLFVDKHYHRQGIAKKLLHTSIIFYQQCRTVSVVTVNSSLYAVDAYKKMGFYAIDTIKTYDGITFCPMEMNL